LSSEETARILTSVKGAPQPAGAPVPLLETRLMPPRMRRDVIRRPRLHEVLDRLASARLTLVSGPAGSGKTVLVSSWCDSPSAGAVAWNSLEPSDNEPGRLWTYIATAVDRLRPGLGRMALLRLSTPGVPLETALDELINGIAAFGQPLRVVLDDLHVLRSETSLGALEYFVDRVPPNAHILATSRSEPAIALARLRARGELGEVRARDLAFTIGEARDVLARTDLVLDGDELALLVERTEGWPAAVYLAAVSLRGAADRHQWICDFHGDNRHVADYLSSEVVDVLDAKSRDFLTRTSILGRFTAAMCDAVLDANDSAEVLRELERSNLFLVALDSRGEWYRYHQLFADLLRIELVHSDPDAERLLHVRACAWCRSQNLIDDALEHAAAAHDDRLVAEILDEQHVVLTFGGRSATLLRHARALDDGLLAEHPAIVAAAAVGSGHDAPSDERQRFLGVLERAVERRFDLSEYAVAVGALAHSAWIDGDVGAAVAHARRAAEACRAEPELAVPALASLAYALFLAGDSEAARTAGREAVEWPKSTRQPAAMITVLATLALVEAGEGRPVIAETIARRAATLMRETGLLGSPLAALAPVALASALELKGDLKQAEPQAEQGEKLRRAPDERVEHVHALLVLARIRAQRRKVSAATADLARAHIALDEFADPGILPELAAQVEQAIHDARTATIRAVEEPTAAELAVLRVLASDLSYREIGQRLFLSLNTVKTHTKGIYRKLGASSRAEAVDRANALGLLD
jgi:LuxR family transcriptional regulator, maltose regulon positive regulatory protein